ncbi:1-(5-phosphoribosyl)-5-[(5-phosphoribosylamino)methylideneamino]imidazole-4-carboxamide isomerase [Candidatus Aerophobetes bacterium]|uniref:1-(5-phosphoribosyl)-5-[(5-phosphoribosylamino)methylideneamino] imidazole-4-carboxamide isomerase n=1 Tax=Aerophobetes bacterium TaxID=2030807 RepID=A0A523TGI5_UNCAE|nr:MAG: 1-(5-phosphoribosyl)-5-[(5-phosphoribosylamino)methylideneamino]imidazole-4-carboxamide isomerase [Candidatus Aerophobetes bacterium]
MLIIPAIDLKEGKCVRLVRGKLSKETIYSKDPIEIARKWVREGAERLHVVDLDGAFQGKPVHMELVGRMAREVRVPIEFGGGIRDFAILKEVLEEGIEYAILGSQALSSDFLEMACKEFGGRIMVSLDTRRGRVLTQGWVKETGVEVGDLARDISRMGVRTIIFTDVGRDGTLKGVNINLIRDFATSAGVDTIVSGGISSLEDVRKILKLRHLGVIGMIVGKALYTGRIKFREAIRLVK